MIVALARKLLVTLWRMATTGEIPEGVILRQLRKKKGDNDSPLGV